MLAQDIAMQVENKKLAAFRAIDDFAASLRGVYADALSELEQQNIIFIAQEAEFAREVRHLAEANSDLLKSLEIETEDHKRTIAQTQQRNSELEGLRKELEYNRKKSIDLMDMVESLTAELGQKNLALETLQEKITTLEDENEKLSSRAQKFKEYVGKSASAYAQVADYGEEHIKRNLPPLQEPDTTTT